MFFFSHLCVRALHSGQYPSRTSKFLCESAVPFETAGSHLHPRRAPLPGHPMVPSSRGQRVVSTASFPVRPFVRSPPARARGPRPVTNCCLPFVSRCGALRAGPASPYAHPLPLRARTPRVWGEGVGARGRPPRAARRQAVPRQIALLCEPSHQALWGVPDRVHAHKGPSAARDASLSHAHAPAALLGVVQTLYDPVLGAMPRVGVGVGVGAGPAADQVAPTGSPPPAPGVAGSPDIEFSAMDSAVSSQFSDPWVPSKDVGRLGMPVLDAKDAGRLSAETPVLDAAGEAAFSWHVAQCVRLARAGA